MGNIIYTMHDVLGDILGSPHNTTPAAVIVNKKAYKSLWELSVPWKQDFIPCLVTCKNEAKPIENQGANVSLVFFVISLWKLHVVMETRSYLH